MRTPIITDYYSLDSTQTFLSWNDTGHPTKIFRGLEKDDLVLYDSTTLNYFTDSVLANQNYYYSVQFYSSENELSAQSKTISIFVILPQKLII
ncbi:MAG: hypothetical protein H6613_16525 [Ignavibacteriales bacterium]|nr:hypothetical protein [Ignavibacteriales bacterium]